MNPTILKIGGGAAINLEGIISDLSSQSCPTIIVHGANSLRDRLARDLGREKTILTSAKGYQSVYSDDSALELIMMAYAGLQNKRIVELCQKNGINAVGLSGLDGRLIRGRRNRGIRVRRDGRTFIRRDRSGKPVSVNRELLGLLLSQGYTPVLCVPIADENGVAINSENDDIVGRLHQAFHADRIIQLIEAPGLLSDASDNSSLLPRLTRAELARMEQSAEGRIKRKLYALIRLFEFSDTTVIVADGRADHPLQDIERGKGTVIG